MIFVTVGTQLPFTRMIKMVDEWAGKHSQFDVFAQIGNTDFLPRNMRYSKHLSPQEFDQKFRDADVIVAHAGMGTIITGIESDKRMILMPRLSKFGEQRNDHQLATAMRFSKFSSITIVNCLEEFERALEKLHSSNGELSKPEIKVSEDLLAAISEFIRG